MGLTFSYDLIDSDETREIYRKMLADDTAKMLAWRSERSQRAHFPIEGLFAAWWFSHGPTGFASGEDAVRYRRELLEAVKVQVGGVDA